MVVLSHVTTIKGDKAVVWEYLNSQLPIKSMIVIGSNTSDNGQSCFTEDVSHFVELRQNRQLALLKRSAKNMYLNMNLGVADFWQICMSNCLFHPFLKSATLVQWSMTDHCWSCYCQLPSWELIGIDNWAYLHISLKICIKSFGVLVISSYFNDIASEWIECIIPYISCIM